MLGFGAKAGLVPLHAWLPDAHSQAPAPVSALMSGVLLSVAFYASCASRPSPTPRSARHSLRTLLLIVALATLAVAALLLIGQRDYKRMLAYSSMEHMGLIALGAAVGTRLAIAAVLLHIARPRPRQSGRVHSAPATSCTAPAPAGSPASAGLATATPALGRRLRPGRRRACSGFPPFRLFASELGIARAGAAAGLGWAIAAAFAARPGRLRRASPPRTGRMLLGPAPTQRPAADRPGASRGDAARRSA